MKKHKKEVWTYMGAIILFGLLVIGGFVYAAGGGFWNIVASKVADKIASQVGPPDLTEPVIGALPGNELFSERWTVNGVPYTYATDNIHTPATTTFCSMKIPGNATSSLVDFRISVLTGTTSVIQLTTATSSLPFATSSGLAIMSNTLEIKRGNYFVATTTKSGIIGPAAGYTYPIVMRPNEYLIVMAWLNSENTTDNFTITGKCYATFAPME